MFLPQQALQGVGYSRLFLALLYVHNVYNFLYLKLRNSAWPLKMLSRYLFTENETKVHCLGHSWALSRPPEPGLVALLVDLVALLPSPISRSQTPILYSYSLFLCVPCTSYCDGRCRFEFLPWP